MSKEENIDTFDGYFKTIGGYNYIYNLKRTSLTEQSLYDACKALEKRVLQLEEELKQASEDLGKYHVKYINAKVEALRVSNHISPLVSQLGEYTSKMRMIYSLLNSKPLKLRKLADIIENKVIHYHSPEEWNVFNINYKPPFIKKKK